MKFAVLGLGKTGHAMAVYLLSRHQEVTAYNRSPAPVKAVNEKGITATGAICGHYPLSATTDMEEAVKGAKYLIIMTVANGHLDIARMLKGKLEEGQRIIVFNGNWGAYEFYAELKEEVRQKNVIIAETSGMLIMAGMPAAAECRLSTIKEEIKLATLPKGQEKALVDELKDVFPQFRLADNVLETSLNNSNPILHSPISLFNLSRLENGEDYGFYTDAVSPAVVRFIEAADSERVAVAKAIGITPISCLEILNMAWENKHDNLYDAIIHNPDYQKIRGPKTVNFRFINEDLPYGLIPVSNLGKKYRVPTPALDAMIALFEFTLGKAAIGTGPNFDAIDLSVAL